MATDRPDSPDRIAGYRVIARLGAGGMGEVFLAEDDRLKRKVAVKRLLPATVADPRAARRLLAEARTVARLDHPHICGIFEVGEDNGLPFFVMPFVEGETLAERLARGPLPVADAVGIAGQVAEALVAAHAQGVLHRDIKPANLMIDARGHVRVMDFGLASVANHDEDVATVSRLTVAGTTLGTVAYMSPEQARGDRLDARSDLFSLGLVIYEMVTGSRPFDRRTVADGLAAVLTEEPRAIAELRPDVPADLQRIVFKTLRKSPDERYQSAADLHADLSGLLRRLQSGSVVAPTTGEFRRPGSVRVAAGVVAVGLLILLVTPTGRGAALRVLQWIAPDAAGNASPSRSPAGEIASIAVLPFVNGGNVEKEYVADGITQTLIDNLSHLPNLKVISRATVFAFKGKTQDVAAIARQLRVGAVMTGAVRETDGQWVIDVEVTNSQDASIVLSHRYVQPLSASALTTESEIAQDVVRNLRVKLSADSQRQLTAVPTTNTEAYPLFLKARFYEKRTTPEGLHQALGFYQQAIDRDPRYAQAYVGMAQTYLELGLYYDAPRETMPKAKERANRALDLDPNLDDARVVLGLVSLNYDWDWQAAAHAMTTSAGLLPSAIEMFTCTAHLLEATGHGPDAEQELRKALVTDPLSTALNTELGCGSYYRRRYDGSIQENKDALDLDADNVLAYWGLGRALGQKKMFREALSELNKVEARLGAAPALIVAEIGYVQAASGRVGDAQATIDKLRVIAKREFVDPYLVAAIYAGMADPTHAFEWLEKAYDVKSASLVALVSEPKWDGLRKDPRFGNLMKRVGF